MKILSRILARLGRTEPVNPDASPKPVDWTLIAHVIVQAIVDRLPGVTSLDVVKAAYIVQILHVGRHGQRAMPDWFKATLMGPYDDHVHAIAKRAVKRRDRGAKPEVVGLPETATLAIVDEVCRTFRESSGAAFTHLTSLPGGAWERLWKPDPALSMPISDPRRIRSRLNAYDGAIIDHASMIDDYRLMTRPLPKAA